MKKISVIMPVYNAEHYLEKALDCLEKQTYSNLEIIVVDDHSTDSSNEIIARYPNILFLSNDENRGAAYSRNLAIQKATGDYIGFLDADDFVEPNYFEELYFSIKTNKSDIAVCDIQTLYEKESYKNSLIRFGTYDGIIDVKDLLVNGLVASPTNKLFISSLIKEYPFDEGIINEDVAAIIPCLIHARKISYTSKTSYFYCQHNLSVQNSSMSLKKFDIFNAVDSCLKKLSSNERKLYINQILFSQLLNFLVYKILEIPHFFNRYKYLKLFLKKLNLYNWYSNPYLLKQLNSVSKIHRIYYNTILFLIHYKLIFFANILVEIKKCYQHHLKKKVIFKNIDFQEVIAKAIQNQKYSDGGVKISVLIPNYNYERFLLERLYSIFSQKIKIYELIFLDDCSKDNSIALFEKVKKSLPKTLIVKAIYNKKNSNCVFKQWQKGCALATGDYIWITEADDYCDARFLKTVIKPLKKNPDIVLSYCNTSFINESGEIIYKNIIPNIDLQHSNHWKKSYINDGKNEIENFMYLNCTISNVSSVLFKNNISENSFEYSRKFKQIGDWMFYINVLKNGKIAYSNKILNYYRIHGNNVTSITKKQNHYDEILSWYDFYQKKFKLTNKQKKNIKLRKKQLEDVWNVKEEKNEKM